MVSLLDIKQMKEVVTIRGDEIEVVGITADGLVHLMQTFPELQKAFAGVQMEIDGIQVIISRLGHTVGEIIAMGCGQGGNPEYIGFAMTQLGAGEQLELLQAIFKLTFPKGIKSFVEGLSKAADSAGVLGKVQRMRSPVQSSDLSQTDTASKTAGG